MSDIISVVGQKGGVGKSMLAQTLAAEMARKGQKVILLDLDTAQRTSHQWGEARKSNNLKPAIDVRLINPDDYGKNYNYRDVDEAANVIIIDAPGWSDEKTKLLAGHSDFLVLPTGASVADLDPTIRLMHELSDRGISKEQMAPALNRVKSATEIKFARERIEAAGYKALPSMLRDMPTYRTLQNVGHAASEADAKNMKEEARDLVAAIQKGLKGAKQERKQEPERFALQPEKFEYKPANESVKKTAAKRNRRHVQ